MRLCDIYIVVDVGIVGFVVVWVCCCSFLAFVYSCVMVVVITRAAGVVEVTGMAARLSSQERAKIEALVTEGVSVEKIACSLGRCITTG